MARSGCPPAPSYVPANYATIEEVVELPKWRRAMAGSYVCICVTRRTACWTWSPKRSAWAARRGCRCRSSTTRRSAGRNGAGARRAGDDRRGARRRAGRHPRPVPVHGVQHRIERPVSAVGPGGRARTRSPRVSGSRHAGAARSRHAGDLQEGARRRRPRTIQIRTLPSDRRYDGKTLADLARDRKLPNSADSGIQLVIELQLRGGFSAIYHSMQEEDVVRIMKHPLTMFDTDGDPVGFGMGHPHPRSYGTFPRVFGR